MNLGECIYMAFSARSIGGTLTRIIRLYHAIFIVYSLGTCHIEMAALLIMHVIS